MIALGLAPLGLVVALLGATLPSALALAYLAQCGIRR